MARRACFRTVSEQLGATLEPLTLPYHHLDDDRTALRAVLGGHNGAQPEAQLEPTRGSLSVYAVAELL